MDISILLWYNTLYNVNLRPKNDDNSQKDTDMNHTIEKAEMMTLPLGLKALNGFKGTGSISIILAGVSVSLVVPTLLYTFGHKYILQGSVMTGLTA